MSPSGPMTPANPSNPASPEDDEADDRTGQIEFEYEAGFDEVPRLPWDSVIRNWIASRKATEAVSPWAVLATVLLGNFAAGVVFTLLSVARENIAEDLNTRYSLVLWSFTIPTLVGAILAPALGRMGDMRGHRKLYLIGLAGGAITSLLVGLAPNVYALIFFRTLAAAATTMLGPSSLAIIFRSFEQQKRVQAMGYWSLVGAGAPVIGVLIGAPIVERFGWRAMFLAQVPCFIAAFWVATKVIPSLPTRAAKEFDWRGAVLLGSATFCVLMGANRGAEWGWSHPVVIAAFAGAPVLIGAFVTWQQKAPSPLLPLRLLKLRNVSAGIGAQTLAQFSYIGAGLYLINDVLVGKSFFALSLTDASKATISRPIAFALIAPIGGWMAVRLGERRVSMFGMACVAGAMFLLAWNPPGESLNALRIAIAVSGLGMGICSPSISATVANAVPESLLGTIGAVQQLMVQMGTVIGTQVMVAVATSGGQGNPSAYRSAFVVAFVVAVLATLTASLCRSPGRVTP
jgi:MFS family permease